jgi:hypothetical protein
MDLYSRPTEAQSSQDWPTKFPIWNMRKPGLKLQETTFQAADNIAKDAFYIAADVWSRKDGKTWGVGKKFGAFSSAERFVTEFLEISKTRCFYEIIRQGRPCKAYFDLEADAGIMTEEQGWIMCKSVIQLWNDRIKRRWPEAVMECAQCLTYMVLNGSRMTSDGLKISYHVIYPWLVFPCNTDT